MAAPAARFRQTQPGLDFIQKLRYSVLQVQYKCRAKFVRRFMPDAVMAAFAMFNLKYPSMLRFDTEAHDDPRMISKCWPEREQESTT